MVDEQAWEERYRSSTAVWSGRPNPQLVADTAALPGGAALDVGCGEGADALWLADRGWRVTAVDFSTTALDRAAQHAAALGTVVAERVTWVHADLTAWTPTEAAFDLVSAQFMHMPDQPRRALFTRLAAAVAPGGTLLIVGHHPSDVQTTARRPPTPDRFFTADEVAASLPAQQWEVLACDARPRPDTDAEGRQITVHDAVLHALRRPSPQSLRPSRSPRSGYRT